MQVARSSPSVDPARRSTVFGAVLLAAVFLALAIAHRAEASETVYWDNLANNSVSFSGTDSSGGGILNYALHDSGAPEAMAYDPANGRLYVAAWNQIVWTAIDGSGSGVLEAPGAEMEAIDGIAIDPRTQTIYWTSFEAFTDQRLGWIGWAHLDGSGGGRLNIEGASMREPRYPVIDTADNRIYWESGIYSSFENFSWAALDGSGGGVVPSDHGENPSEVVGGLVVDPAAGRLYWLNTKYDEVEEPVESLKWGDISGVGSGEVETSGAAFDEAFGLAFDPGRGTFYWGNIGNETASENAIGTASLAGGGGGITPAEAPVSDPEFPVVLKSPTGTGAPQLTRDGTALSCSQGNWSGDYPGSFVYGAPRTFSYQWLLNGAPIEGATTSSYMAAAAGSYSCTVTAENYAGSGSQTSGPATVTGASLSTTLQTKVVKAKAGKVAKVIVGLTNTGELASVPVRVCAELDKKAKKGLKVPYCTEVGAIVTAGSTVATLGIKTKHDAKGTYEFPVVVKGATGNSVTATVKVIAAKKKHR
ncbi:MAG TPA: hypothetical protein VMH33_13220 [Solirubrobacterales bacterium]|nr:hypothetical protein [Solirubrobacterales bacterium]